MCGSTLCPRETTYFSFYVEKCYWDWVISCFNCSLSLNDVFDYASILSYFIPFFMNTRLMHQASPHKCTNYTMPVLVPRILKAKTIQCASKTLKIRFFQSLNKETIVLTSSVLSIWHYTYLALPDNTFIP